MKKVLALIGSVVVANSTATAFAAQRLVPSQYSTIQQAITAAVNGDEVVISPGTYTGTNNRDINPLGKQIVIRSSNPADPAIVAATIIDAGGLNHRGFYIRTNETSLCIIDGLTVQNGNISPGGGIYVSSASPVIRRCVITANAAGQFGSGGGVSCGNSTLLEDCTIHSNSAGNGGGVHITGFSGSAKLRRCTVRHNISTSSGAGIYTSVASSLDNCLVHNNQAQASADGGGVYSVSTSFLVRNCTVANNTASEGGGLYGSIDIYNSIIWGNSATSGNGNQIYVNDTVDVSFSDIQGGQGDVFVDFDGLLSWYGGNISSNPLYLGNFRLLQNSPCIDAAENLNAPSGVTTDIWGNIRFFDDPAITDTGSGSPPIIDIGASEFNSTSTPLIDSDGDGVHDGNDQCPNTISGVTVNAVGCPPVVRGDLDNDGDVDQEDFAVFQNCMSGPDIPGNPGC